MQIKSRLESRKRKHFRLRKKVIGTPNRPRMSVCFTGKHIYVQFVDDLNHRTLASISTVMAAAKGEKANLRGAEKIGTLAGEVAKEKNISQIVFDRGGFKYHGRVKVLAGAARETGLVF